MFKLSKTSRLFLAIGIFVILCASLGVAYFQRVKELGQLSQELALAQVRLATYSPEKLDSEINDLEYDLAQAESRLRNTKTQLTQTIESIEASDTLFELAEDTGVEVTDITSLAWVDEELAELDFRSLQITVKIEGDVSELIDFVYEWTQEYPTGIVRLVDIVIPEPSTDEADEEEMPEASIRFTIYNYRGD